MSPSKKGEILYLYLAVSATAVSAVLIREGDETQLPVYYVSQAFQEAKAKFPRIEKIAFAFIVASCKLCPLLPGKSYLGDDKPTHKEVYE